MPSQTYESLPNSVLAWKRNQKLGRFDPSAPSAADLARQRSEHDTSLISSRGIVVGKRCRVNGDDGRRGEVMFTGEVVGLGGEREAGCRWVGVRLDEPVGRNDGSVEVEIVVERSGDGDGEVETEKRKEKRRLFECPDKFGVFVRPEKVEVGEQFGVLDDLVDEDMEEI
jgi:tubulin-specific chaperone B